MFQRPVTRSLLTSILLPVCYLPREYNDFLGIQRASEQPVDL